MTKNKDKMINKTYKGASGLWYHNKNVHKMKTRPNPRKKKNINEDTLIIKNNDIKVLKRKLKKETQIKDNKKNNILKKRDKNSSDKRKKLSSTKKSNIFNIKNISSIDFLKLIDEIVIPDTIDNYFNEDSEDSDFYKCY